MISEQLEEPITTYQEDTPKRQALVVANPHASTVSDHLKHLVVYALESRYSVEAVATENQGHATEIARDAAKEGYDLVIAFGGDGTVNEVVNGLVGTDTALGVLPGGSTNAFCRILGIPADIVDATEHLVELANNWNPRKVDLGVANGRYFTFVAGIGVDATATNYANHRPFLKARFSSLYFSYSTARAFFSKLPEIEIDFGDGNPITGVSLVLQNCPLFSYIGSRPISVTEAETLNSGTLAGIVLKRKCLRDAPFLTARLLSKKLIIPKHRRIASYTDLTYVHVTSKDGTKFTAQVDGDNLGELDEIHFSVAPQSLTVVA